MKHRIVTFIALAAAVLSAAAAAPRPNIIVILADDLGYADLGCQRSPDVKTPNIDALAANGVRCTSGYVTAPQCSPSRAGLVSGCYQQRFGHEGNPNFPLTLMRGSKTIADHLKAAGYATGHFGKWHLGGQRDVGAAPLITEYGFDESLTNFEGLGPRVLPLCEAGDGKPPRKHALGSDKLGRGPIRWEDRSKITGVFAEAALSFVKKAEAAGTPFYVNVWPDDVHSPFFPPVAMRGDGSKRKLYLSVLESMDRQLEPLFTHLRSSERLRGNTLVLVCSDNGPEQGAGRAGPFRGGKGMLYEGGIRSPLIVWGPGLGEAKRAGAVNRESVLAAIDLAPTLLSVAGIMPPADVAYDGVALRDTLLGRSEASRERPLFFRRPPDRGSLADEQDLPDLAVREGTWKLLCEYDGTKPQLYDLAGDPGEKTDLAAKQAETAARLAKAAVEWHRSMPPDRGDRK